MHLFFIRCANNFYLLLFRLSHQECLLHSCWGLVAGVFFRHPLVVTPSAPLCMRSLARCWRFSVHRIHPVFRGPDLNPRSSTLAQSCGHQKKSSGCHDESSAAELRCCGSCSCAACTFPSSLDYIIASASGGGFCLLTNINFFSSAIECC